jgi:hypothetical protein
MGAAYLICGVIPALFIKEKLYISTANGCAANSGRKAFGHVGGIYAIRNAVEETKTFNCFL